MKMFYLENNVADIWKGNINPTNLGVVAPGPHSSPTISLYKGGRRIT